MNLDLVVGRPQARVVVFDRSRKAMLGKKCSEKMGSIAATPPRPGRFTVTVKGGKIAELQISEN